MQELNLDEYRLKLENLAARLTKGVASLTNEALHPTGSMSRAADGQADPGTEAAEEELARALLDTEGTLLTEVNAALVRVQAGSFGKCEECGAAISKARLEALPYARLCIACARKQQ